MLAFGLRGNLFRSEDGGTTWTAIPTGTTALLDAGARIDADTVVDRRASRASSSSAATAAAASSCSQQDDRKAIAAVVPSGDGALIVAGEGGVRRLPLPGGAAP